MREGWETLKMSEVYIVKDGTHDSPKFQNKGYPLITSKNLKNGTLNFEKIKFISEKDYNQINKRSKVDVGDVLFAMIGTIGNPVVITEEPKYAIKNVALFKISGNQESRYLKYYLESKEVIDKMNQEAKGTTQRFVGLGYLRDFIIPIPPLPEQQQIVTLLDQAFAAIDQANANIEKNIENAKELFQAKLNEVFSQKGEGWEEKRLGEICKVERGSSPRPIQKYLTEEESGVHWIKIGDVGDGEKYVWRTKQKITKEGAKKSRFVDVGDLILSNSMSFGRPYIMKIPGYIHDGWFVLRLPENLDPEYFWQILGSPYLRNQFNDLAAGAIVKNISGDLVKQALVPIPPLNEQKAIVIEIEDFGKYIEAVEQNFEKKRKGLEDLKKSLLQKAFAGELTKNHFDIADRHNQGKLQEV